MLHDFFSSALETKLLSRMPTHVGLSMGRVYQQLSSPDALVNGKGCQTFLSAFDAPYDVSLRPSSWGRDLNKVFDALFDG
jgi:hypothetical protein